MQKLIIRGSTVIDPQAHTETKKDILIENNRIIGVESHIDSIDAQVFHADKYYCAPGLVDIHVHLRDPGQTDKETIETGCSAAAAGGVTTLACMPNTVPTADNPRIIQDILERSKNARAHVYPVASITMSLKGESLTDFCALKKAGAVALSDDGRPVVNTGLMKEAMSRASSLNMKILSHCEELSLVNSGVMNEGKVSQALGVAGIHRAAEETAVAREIALSAATGFPVHICHISTRGSVALLRDAKKRGVPVTGETAPHYFMLTDELLLKKDADYRMNPPLRTEDDVQAVIEGLCDGTLTVIATDHAPHTTEEKADFLHAPNGAIGMETSLAVGITALVKKGYLSLTRLIELMSLEPAKVLGLTAGTLSVGAPADLVLFDPNETWAVSPEALHGKSQNTPFKGMQLIGRVKATIMDGKFVYRDSQLL